MVKLAVRKSDGTKWAVKVIEKTSLSQEDEEALKTEVQILEVGGSQRRVAVKKSLALSSHGCCSIATRTK